MNKLLVICGPTATGKTDLALKIARKFNGEIVSADSRQVYKGMDIGTGKDLPTGAKIKYPWFSKWGYYDFGGVHVWGLDLVDPKNEFSISPYLKFAKKIISEIRKRNKLPIIVGGTGFYIRGIVDGIPTAEVPRSDGLRKILQGKTADELYEILSQIDSIRAGAMNSSDKKNPRRLIRAIEVAQYSIDHKLPPPHLPNNKSKSALFVGLTGTSEFLNDKINRRVEKRIAMGIKEEIKKLLSQGVSWNDQSMMSLGYRQYRDFFEGEVSEKVTIEEWKKEERKYAHRQMVWFKKDKRINWFDIANSSYTKKVEKLINKWYINPDA